MGEDRVIRFSVAEGLERRHLHAVDAAGEIGPVASVPYVGLGVGKEALGVRIPVNVISHSG
jgi:hypothetical protein